MKRYTKFGRADERGVFSAYVDQFGRPETYRAREARLEAELAGMEKMAAGLSRRRAEIIHEENLMSGTPFEERD